MVNSFEKPIVIVGACGFGKEVAWLAKECGRVVSGFLDDDADLHGSEIFGLPVLGGIDTVSNYKESDFIVAIGSPAVRSKLVGRVVTQLPSVNWASLVHPSVSLDPSVKVGAGSLITAGCVLTVDIVIGEHCIVNINSTVGHDCVFSDFVTVAPLVAVSGNVTLRSCVEVGTGASIRQGVTIEEGAMLGMGAVLTKNQPANSVFVGSPAKELRRN